MINANCDGAGPHVPGEVRRYPTGGGGAALLCRSCWAKENRFNYERGKETGQPHNWPQKNYFDAEIYEGV